MHGVSVRSLSFPAKGGGNCLEEASILIWFPSRKPLVSHPLLPEGNYLVFIRKVSTGTGLELPRSLS